ncbi:thioredoxin domain-containing protein [soil metagenome]
MNVRAEEEAAPRGVRAPLPSQEEIAKLPEDGGDEFNRLIFEKSPYLLQHARNPVDWYPWGEEAFAKAEAEGKPVLMSVGYATCHWCHVMEHESFEDEEVAKMVNDWFVPVKVDREERPDVDEVYMTVTQAMTGSGGWPMTVVMTADQRPFFAGTYFPKNDRLGRPGFTSILSRLHDAWENDRTNVLEVAGNVKEALGGMVVGTPGELPDEAILKGAFQALAPTFDAERGGFGSAPKFPTPPLLSFLLRFYDRSGEGQALAMVEKTLREMRLGGMYDQIGFGTHRYSTDADWLVPHFEKMLYDQALLAIANLEAYQVTEKPEYAQTAREIFTYVLRDMTSPEGGFYSAEDADSEGEEGVFYLWTPEQVAAVLGDEDARIWNAIFHIQPGGNYADEVSREKTGSSIPHLKVPLAEAAEAAGSDVASVEGMREKLFTARDARVHPLKDDKILTDWNGLMIAALAKGGRVLGDESLTAAAKKAGDFALSTLRTDDGRLVKRYRQGEAGLTAHLEDYAFMVWGLIDLYETTFEVGYLREALALTDVMLASFWDAEAGGLFMTAEDSEELLVRAKKLYGGAIPSGNAVAALNLLRLARLSGRTEYEERYEALAKAFGGELEQQAGVYPQMLIAVDFAAGPAYEVALVGDPESADLRAMLAPIQKRFFPRVVTLFRPAGEADPAIGQIAEFTQGQVAVDGKATAYVCQNFSCNLPTTEVSKMLELLGVAPEGVAPEEE